MTEFDYDVRARKQLARQAKYKKNGSKSKKCTLRQDTMTAAQLRKLNGEVIKFNMNEPIRSWREFKALSGDSAREYISNISKTYRASIGDFSRMFGVAYNTTKKYFGEIGASASVGRMPADSVPAWMDFLGTSQADVEENPMDTDERTVGDPPAETPAEEPVDTTIEEPVEEPVDEPTSKQKMEMREFELTFSGAIDFAGVVNSLKYILGSAPNGQLRISFSSKKDTPSWL